MLPSWRHVGKNNKSTGLPGIMTHMMDATRKSACGIAYVTRYLFRRDCSHHDDY